MNARLVCFARLVALALAANPLAPRPALAQDPLAHDATPPEAPANPVAREEQKAAPNLAELLAGQPVALIVAAQEPTQAPSLMGHVFLHFGAVRPATGELARDGLAFEYAAENDDSTLTTVRRGLFGGYTGILHDYPTGQIADRYRVKQRRDLWVYPLRLTDDERARLVAAVVREKSASFAYAFATNNCATRLQRLLAEAFDGPPRDELEADSIVSPGSLAHAVTRLDLVASAPAQLRARGNASAFAHFERDASPPSPPPDQNHGPARLDLHAGYFGYLRDFGASISMRFGVHELVEPAWREFDYHGASILAGGVSVDGSGTVRLTHASLVDLEVFDFDDGSVFAWTGRMNLGYRGRGTGGFRDELLGVGAEVGPGLRARFSSGELLAFLRAGVAPGVSLAGGEAAARMPAGGIAGVLFRGAGPVSLRLEGGVFRALPWDVGTAYLARGEALVRVGRGAALAVHVVALEIGISPAAGLVLWGP